MRLQVLLLTLLSLIAIALAWTKEDYEIFDLVSAIEAAEGKGTTFYSWLEVSPKATATDIGRAYRKKSMTMHPDKNPGVKGIQERFARLGVVAAILRDPEQRKRYDFFYKNGVPRWRGTGYYYSRYRPGMGTVLVFLALLSSSVQYGIQWFNYKKDLERIERFVEKARAAAWGPKKIPQPTAKKVRVSLSDAGPFDDSRSVEMLVEGDKVFLVGDGDPIPLDANVATKPTIGGTWVFSSIAAVISKVTNRAPKVEAEVADPKKEADSSSSDEEVADAPEAVGTTPGGSRKGTPSASMAGGRRRKVVPKKK